MNINLTNDEADVLWEILSHAKKEGFLFSEDERTPRAVDSLMGKLLKIFTERLAGPPPNSSLS